MTTQISTKVRMVICPGCRGLLSEPSNVPVYKCGGCDTTLQSKSWRKDPNSDERFQETNQIPESEPYPIVKENEMSSTNLDLTPSGGKSSLDGDKPCDQGELGDYNRGQCEDMNSSTVLPGSHEVHICENEDMSTVGVEQLKQDKEGECPLPQDAERCEIELQDDNVERLASRNSSAEFPSSSELFCPETNASNPEIEEHMESDEKNPSEQCSGKDEKEFGDSQIGSCGSDNFLDDVSSSTKYYDQENRLLPNGGGYSEAEESIQLTQENNEKSLNKSRDKNGEQCKDKSLSHKVGGYENKDISAEVIEQLKQDNDSRFPSVEDAERCQNGSQDEDGKRIEVRKSFAEFSCSSELASHEADVSSTIPEANEHVESDGRNPLEQSPGRNRKEHEDCQTECCEGENCLDKVQSLLEKDHQKNNVARDDGDHREGDETTLLSPQNNENDLNCFKAHSGRFPGGTCNTISLFDPDEIVSHPNVKSSLSTGETVDKDIKSLHVSRISSTGNFVNADTGDSSVAIPGPSNEDSTHADLIPPDAEHLEHSQGENIRSFGRVSSVDTLDSVSLVDPGSNLSAKRGDMSKSPTAKSFYAYEGSESSYDGTNDQVPNHVLPPSRKKFKDKVSSSTAELRKKNGLTNKLSSELEMRYWEASSLSGLHGKQYRGMEGSSSRQVELPETRRHGYKSGKRVRLDREEAASRLAFPSRDLQPGHRNKSPSSYHRNLLQNHQVFHSSERTVCSEPEKMELLRMMYDLKDQLSRMQFSKQMGNGRVPTGSLEQKSSPLFYNHLPPERDLYADFSHPRYGTHDLSKGWLHQYKDSRMAFSGEAVPCRHQVNCSCLHCCPQDWRCSAQLPSRSMLYNSGPCMVHTGHNNCYNVIPSGSSTPQHLMSSEHSLRGYEMMSDDQKHRDKEMKGLHLRERYCMTKQRLRPIAGGAPLISCYHCSELLQMPSDFLLFKKRYHQLRCNACQNVLKFSLVGGVHVVPYLPEASAPPPSEADDYSDAMSRRNLVPISHVNSSSHAEPVSCSDDYGLSFCRSFSTEGEAPFLTPSTELVEQKTYNRKMSSGSSYEPLKDKKMKSVVTEYRNINENFVESSKSAKASSKAVRTNKISSEIEELPAPSNSPLHRLMGYSSPSQVLNK